MLASNRLTDPDLIRWLGRTHFVSNEDKQYFYHTGTGFSIRFYGTSLTIEIHATNTDSSSKRPYFIVSLDDEIAPEGKVVYLTEATTSLTLVEGLEVGEHVITFLKRSEPIDSTTAISSIETDGYFLSPPPASLINVLILGGSGISGHGNLGIPNTARTTANSDSTQAFGYLTARALQAEFQFVAASGWGLKWGHNPSNRNGTVNIRTAFNTIGIQTNEELVDIPFDTQSFIPTYIIVNLGGNDFDAHIANLEGAAIGLAKAEFRAAVAEFVTTLHALYPQAIILWTHTGSQNGVEADAAIGDVDPRHTYVHVVVIPKVGSDGDLEGAAGHASVKTHQRTAIELVEFIQSINAK
jgi:hypothetical protein